MAPSRLTDQTRRITRRRLRYHKPVIRECHAQPTELRAAPRRFLSNQCWSSRAPGMSFAMAQHYASEVGFIPPGGCTTRTSHMMTVSISADRLIPCSRHTTSTRLARSRPIRQLTLTH